MLHCSFSRINNHYLFLILAAFICHRCGRLTEETISYSGRYLQFHNVIMKGLHVRNEHRAELQLTTKEGICPKGADSTEK